MKFYSKYNTEREINYKTIKIFNAARKKILLYHLGANEVILDNYFKKNNNITLKLLCINILFNSKFNVDFNGNIIVDTGEKWDRCARFITFGDGIIPGSRILIDALQM